MPEFHTPNKENWIVSPTSHPPQVFSPPCDSPAQEPCSVEKVNIQTNLYVAGVKSTFVRTWLLYYLHPGAFWGVLRLRAEKVCSSLSYGAGIPLPSCKQFWVPFFQVRSIYAGTRAGVDEDAPCFQGRVLQARLPRAVPACQFVSLSR